MLHYDKLWEKVWDGFCVSMSQGTTESWHVLLENEKIIRARKNWDPLWASCLMSQFRVACGVLPSDTTSLKLYQIIWKTLWHITHPFIVKGSDMPLLQVTNSHISYQDVSHGFPSWVFPPKTPQTTALSLPHSPPFPLWWTGGELEAQKGKVIGWDKNHFLETAMK